MFVTHETRELTEPYINMTDYNIFEYKVPKTFLFYASLTDRPNRDLSVNIKSQTTFLSKPNSELQTQINFENKHCMLVGTEEVKTPK